MVNIYNFLAMQTAHRSFGIRFVILFLFWLSTHLAFGQGEQNPIPKEVRTNPDGSLYVRYGYQEYLPVGYDTQPETKWPLIIHMVGVGERGFGTVQHLDTIAGIGISKLVENGKDFPFLIMSPQPTGDPKVYPTGESGKFVPDTLGVFIDYVLENYNVDPSRVYITAFSAAAIEAGKYIAKNTEKIAAFIPIAGSARYFKNFCNLTNIPVWAFHNLYDYKIPSSGSTGMVNDLKKCDPPPLVRPKVTVYPDSLHDAWTRTYNGKGMEQAIEGDNYDLFNETIYDWFLRYSKTKVLLADAGKDQIIILPTDSVVLEGSSNLTNGVTYQWAQIGDKPNKATLKNANTATLTATGLIKGEYEFTLTVTDAQNNVDRDKVKVIVKSLVADAGNDKTIFLPTDSVTLSGKAVDTGSDPEQTFTYKWKQVGGPLGIIATISDSTAATTTVSKLNTVGVYQFEFTVVDNSGATAKDIVAVNVRNSNNALIANAGNDTIVTLPVEKVTFNGSGIDTVNTITGYSWTQISGQEVTLLNTDSANLEVTDLKKGIFTFELTVTNDNDGTASDTVVLAVLAPNTKLIANAGNDTTVVLPLEQLEVTGSGIDPYNDNAIIGYQWTKLGGPEVTLANTDQATLSLSNLMKGTYEFELTVTNDNDGQDKDTVNIFVKTTNDSLVANAGEDMTVGLPQESVEVVGLGSDPYNEIIGYQWQKISGPEVTLTGEDQATLTVSNLQEGTYEFELTVTNDNEGIAKDTVVLTACQAPTIAPIEDITTTLDQMPLEVPLNISNADLSTESISAVSDNQEFISDEDIEIVVENGEAKLLITADALDSANITVMVGETCVGSQQFKVTVNAVTGIEEELKDLAIVYPNPSEDVFLVKWKEVVPKGTEISVFTTEGFLIQKFNVREAQHAFTIDLSSRAKGSYLLLIRVNNKTRSYRLIKQ